MSKKLFAALLAAIAALAAAAVAAAHQTAYDRGTAVTLHVAPDDEPVAGVPATITVVRVRPVKGGRFTFGSCRCRLRVADASGAPLLDRGAGKRTQFTCCCSFSPVSERSTGSGRFGVCATQPVRGRRPATPAGCCAACCAPRSRSCWPPSR